MLAQPTHQNLTFRCKSPSTCTKSETQTEAKKTPKVEEANASTGVASEEELTKQ